VYCFATCKITTSILQKLFYPRLKTTKNTKIWFRRTTWFVHFTILMIWRKLWKYSISPINIYWSINFNFQT